MLRSPVIHTSSVNTAQHFVTLKARGRKERSVIWLAMSRLQQVLETTIKKYDNHPQTKLERAEKFRTRTGSFVPVWPKAEPNRGPWVSIDHAQMPISDAILTKRKGLETLELDQTIDEKCKFSDNRARDLNESDRSNPSPKTKRKVTSESREWRSSADDRDGENPTKEQGSFFFAATETKRIMACKRKISPVQCSEGDSFFHHILFRIGPFSIFYYLFYLFIFCIFTRNKNLNCWLKFKYQQ